jgi:hypothetical protein
MIENKCTTIIPYNDKSKKIAPMKFWFNENPGLAYPIVYLPSLNKDTFVHSISFDLYDKLFPTYSSFNLSRINDLLPQPINLTDFNILTVKKDILCYNYINLCQDEYS